MSTANPYAVLGVAEDASSQEIKKAYRRQMRLAAVDTHPDVSDAEREVLQQRMVEVNQAFEVLRGEGREALDAQLRRQRAADALREQQLRREQAYQQAAWEAAQRQRDDERRYREAARVREYVDEGPGYRYEVRLEGPVVTQEVLDALWELLAPRAGPDVHQRIEVTRGQWESGASWTSGVDGLALAGLEHCEPATYRFAGRGGQGVYGGPRGDLYVTVVHVDDLGLPVVGGFRAPRTSEPSGVGAARAPAARAPVARDTDLSRRRAPAAAVALALRLLVTALRWALVVVAGVVVVVVVTTVVLMLVAAMG